jgi:hypothetical protein
MGMTDELAIGHYFKRATLIEAAFGNTDHHLARYEFLSLGQAESRVMASGSGASGRPTASSTAARSGGCR